VLDQHASLDFYSASPLKEHVQSVDRHVTPLGHIILISRVNQSFLLILNAPCLVEKQQILIL